MFKTLLTAAFPQVVRQAHVAEVLLNAPHKLNSLDEQALADLSQAYDDAAAAAFRGEVRALLLRGEGRAFCAGRGNSERDAGE